MALPRSRAAAPIAVAPATATAAAALRRVTGTWSQPEPWTVAVLLVTGVMVIARHPIAKMIGTEAETPPAEPSVVATAPAVPVTAGQGAAAALAPAPTHAPRDPFRALVTAGGAVLAPEAAGARIPTTGQVAHPQHSRPATSGTGTGGVTCAGTGYTVVSGDTLWTIAAHAVRSADGNRVTVAWHRIYRANRPSLGSDPSVLAVGTKLCVPSSI
jgi:nucleoid-associated protein YgaU